MEARLDGTPRLGPALRRSPLNYSSESDRRLIGPALLVRDADAGGRGAAERAGHPSEDSARRESGLGGSHRRWIAALMGVDGRMLLWELEV